MQAARTPEASRKPGGHLLLLPGAARRDSASWGQWRVWAVRTRGAVVSPAGAWNGRPGAAVKVGALPGVSASWWLSSHDSSALLVFCGRDRDFFLSLLSRYIQDPAFETFPVCSGIGGPGAPGAPVPLVCL